MASPVDLRTGPLPHMLNSENPKIKDKARIQEIDKRYPQIVSSSFCMKSLEQNGAKGEDVDLITDVEVINQELLCDLQMAGKACSLVKEQAKRKKELLPLLEVLQGVMLHLDQGWPCTEGERKVLASCALVNNKEGINREWDKFIQQNLNNADLSNKKVINRGYDKLKQQPGYWGLRPPTEILPGILIDPGQAKHSPCWHPKWEGKQGSHFPPKMSVEVTVKLARILVEQVLTFSEMPQSNYVPPKIVWTIEKCKKWKDYFTGQLKTIGIEAGYVLEQKCWHIHFFPEDS